MKSKLSSKIGILFLCILFVQLVALTVFAAASLPDGLEGGGSGVWNAEDNTYTVTATGGCNSTGKDSMTLKNVSGSDAVLSFTYVENTDNQNAKPSYSVSSDMAQLPTLTSGQTYTHNMQVGEVLKFEVATTQNGKYNSSIVLSDISITPVQYIDIGLQAAENGSYTVTYTPKDSTAAVTESVTESKTIAVSNAEGATLVATPAANYKFIGWRDATTGKLLSSSATYVEKTARTVKPEFIASSVAAPFQVKDGQAHYYLNDALAEVSGGGVIIVVEEATVPAGNYTISSGVTLLIPYNDANTVCTTEPTITESNTTPSVYRMLTMASGAHITVNGAISVGGQQYCSRPIGAVSGKYGVIEMAEGSSITVKNGGNLYAWGYIAGVKGSNNTVSEGTVTIESGGTVYEDFQIVDWRGGSATTTMIDNSNKVFPVSQYYVQNVQVPMTLKTGATEKTFTSVKVTWAGIQKAPITFIGTGGMFVLGENSAVVKDYNEVTDRLTLELTSGSVSLGSVKMTLKISTLGGTKTIDSAKYVLPLNNNITIIANSGTTLSAANDVAMLPGSEMILEEGSNFNITSGSYYIYDLDEWTYDTTSTEMTTILNGNASNNGGYCSEFNWVMAAAPHAHDRIKTRTAADLEDAEVKVNGTITVSDGAYVYTTVGGANVYSTGTGVIEFKGAAGSSETTYQAVATGSDRTGVDYIKIPITPAKLKNENDTYVETSGATAATTYYHDHYICCDDTTDNPSASKHGNWLVGEHTPSSEVTKEASCAAVGEITYTCNCNIHSYTEEIPKLPHAEVTDAAVDATCTETGLTEGSHCSVCGEVIIPQEVVPMLSHTDKNKDHICDICGNEASTCTDADKNHACDLCKAILSHCEDNATGHACNLCGQIISNCVDADDDHICDICGAQLCIDGNQDLICDHCGGIVCSLAYINAAYAAEVELMFGLNIPESILSADNAYVKLTKYGRWEPVETTYTMAQLRENGLTSGAYVAEAAVASGEMGRNISIQIFDGNGKAVNLVAKSTGRALGATPAYAVLDYAKLVLQSGKDEQKEITKALLVYGGYAQKYFKVDQDRPVYDALTELGIEIPSLDEITADSIDAAVQRDSTEIGISISNHQPFLDSAVYLRLYYTLEEGKTLDDYTFELTYIVNHVDRTKSVSAVSEDGVCYVDITDIPAAYLDHMYTVTATENETQETYAVKDSVLCWVKAVLGASSATTDQVNLAKAIYYYNDAANTFFGK